MSLHRTIKKATYATGFIIVVCGIGYLIALPFLAQRAANNQSATPTPSFNEIAIENVVVLPHLDPAGPKGKTVDVVARIKNRNVRAGTGTYPVQFVVNDPSGNQIATASQDAYVLPGGLQYLVALDIPIPADKQFGAVQIIAPPSPSLRVLPDSVQLPDFSVFLRERTRFTLGSQRLEQQTGIVTNNSTFDWERVEVTGVAVDDTGRIVGVGKTFVGKLLVGEQREFTLQWPLPNATTSRVITVASTNIYSPENVVHILGNPGALR